MVSYYSVNVCFFGSDVLTLGNDAITATVGSMSAEQIFTTYARHIGIGGIATAGVIGIINSWGIIRGAVGLAAKELKGKIRKLIWKRYAHRKIYR